MFGMGARHGSGSRDSVDIADWVQSSFTPIRVDGVVLFNLTDSPS